MTTTTRRSRRRNIRIRRRKHRHQRQQQQHHSSRSTTTTASRKQIKAKQKPTLAAIKVKIPHSCPFAWGPDLTLIRSDLGNKMCPYLGPGLVPQAGNLILVWPFPGPGSKVRPALQPKTGFPGRSDLWFNTSSSSPNGVPQTPSTLKRFQVQTPDPSEGS